MILKKVMSYKSYVVYKAIVGWSPTIYSKQFEQRMQANSKSFTTQWHICVFFLYISLSLSLCQSLSNQWNVLFMSANRASRVFRWLLIPSQQMVWVESKLYTATSIQNHGNSLCLTNSSKANLQSQQVYQVLSSTWILLSLWAHDRC